MQALAYNVFDPTACGFPAPRVPLLPTLTMHALRGLGAGKFAAIGAGRERRPYTRGRYALHDAYRMAGVGPEGALLAPAYHCRTMLDPAIRLAAPILLYGVDQSLNADVANIAELVECARTPVRALVFTHYFGFEHAVAPIRDFCDAHQIVLVEDCSHALFVSRDTPRLGTSGRYVTASPYKLFPCEEGGLLLAKAGAPLPAVRAAPWLAECRALFHAFERVWARRGTRRLPDPERLDADLDRVLSGRIERGGHSRATLDGTSIHYDPAEEGRAAPLVSRALASLCDVDHIARRRRENYQRWSHAVQRMPNCRPLFQALPDDCVPYMFPLLIDEPDTHFYVLKQLGMPIWRWDDMADSSCAVSQHLREHLLHLPCHQALTEQEFEWMTRAVAKVMRLPPLH